ncbi:peptidoglycan-binding protein [Streptomyces sp. H34-S4]|uniref:peptidoglycan-binding protein n=1 Tax=Streptomyces sp. H34-S4 TaxID=2996463 RepID=UPI00226D802F|nr:peptidoglycan-binding protein [Streptomyces sp. H34-S4]MCY0933620.1 peptidoglycan-binding protein [Streptomyces sp. H34-S4]
MPVSIVSRSEWGAKPWNGNPNYVALSQRTEFFIHYDGADHINRTGVSVPQAIERGHLGQGWAGVGYNFVVDQDGTAFEGRGWTLQGAHCPNHNVSGIGVQIAIGGDQEPSAKALATARALYDEACRKTGKTLAKKGHKDGIATSCPGGKLYAWVKAGMPADGYEGGPEPEKPATWDGSSFPGASSFVLGKSHPAVTLLGQRLVAHGFGSHYKEGPGPTFSEADRSATAAFQRAQGWSGSDADGYPGSETWKRLLAPAKQAPAPAPSSIVALNPAVAPGARHAQVQELQQLLIKAGYGPIPGAYSTYYGPETQRAVGRFHNRNPQYRAAGTSYDPAIGRRGFVELQKEAGRQ